LTTLFATRFHGGISREICTIARYHHNAGFELASEALQAGQKKFWPNRYITMGTNIQRCALKQLGYLVRP